MFTDLGRLVTGDRFTIEVFGEVPRFPWWVVWIAAAVVLSALNP